MKIAIGRKTYYVLKYTPAMVIEADRLLTKGTTVSLGGEPDFLDEVIPFIAHKVFAGQFSADDLLHRYESPTVLADMLGILGAVRGTVLDELARFPSERSEKNAHRGRTSPKA